MRSVELLLPEYVRVGLELLPVQRRAPELTIWRQTSSGPIICDLLIFNDLAEIHEITEIVDGNCSIKRPVL